MAILHQPFTIRAMRICSLLPGATEVIAGLGLTDKLVGISHECDYPPEIRTKPIMIQPTIRPDRASSYEIDRHVRAALANNQRLYTLDEALFTRMQPDLIITQDLCHVCAITPDQLQRAIMELPAQPALLTLNPTGLDQVLTDIERIGAATGTEREARTLAASLRARLQSVSAHVTQTKERPKVACLEWLDPLYTAGHWVPEMVALAGGVDALGEAGKPSKQVAWSRLLAAEPDLVVLMPCGFSIERTLQEIGRLTSHPDWHRLPAVRNHRVYAVDAASYFNRPGPRLVEGVKILATLLHPSLFGNAMPAAAQRITAPG